MGAIIEKEVYRIINDGDNVVLEVGDKFSIPKSFIKGIEKLSENKHRIYFEGITYNNIEYCYIDLNKREFEIIKKHIL